ncbi:DNA polymerase III subunit gamma/tau [Candidatus Vidania fulgoroideorum]
MNLYNKYRPKNMLEFVGQNHLKKSIFYFLKNKKIPSSFLFFGKKGTGKTSFVNIFYRLLNCKQFNNNLFCNTCKNCLLIKKNKNLDYYKLDASINRKIEKVEELISYFKYLPIKFKYKLICIDEIHLLSKQAISLLLNFLEFPPSYIKFILLTTELDKIPTPIVSRCILFNFKNLTVNQIFKHLINISKKENIICTRKSLLLISEYSNGSIRDSLNLLEIAKSISSKITSKIINLFLNKISKRFIFKIFKFLLNRKISNILKIIIWIKKKKIEISKFILNILNYLNCLIFYKFFYNYFPFYYYNENENNYKYINLSFLKLKLIRRYLIYEISYFNYIVYDYNCLFCLFFEIYYIINTQERI